MSIISKIKAGYVWDLVSRCSVISFACSLLCIPLAINAEQENQILIDNSGNSLLSVKGEEPFVVYEEIKEIPSTGGFLTKNNVWVDKGSVRLTTLNGECFVFTSRKRSGSFMFNDHDADSEEPAFKHAENGFTFRLWLLDKTQPEQEGDPELMRIKAQVTRP